ncbi:unnamed protein product, partial [Medioppia subpectinata]
LIWKFANPVTKRRHSIVNFKLIDGQEKDRLHVAITGKTFKILRDYYPDLLKKVAIRGTVFARMAPEQKQQLVELLQELGYIVGMCGDGANDMASLKQAHAGVSLSEAEASVASPFTSKTPNISCIPILIREGRASIVTSFGILKYMALYSLTQFFSVIILYTFYSNLTDKEFLYEDLFLITLFVTLCKTMTIELFHLMSELVGRTEAFDQLNRKPPPSSLIGITPLSSIALQILLVAFIQVIAIVIVWQQYWYRPHKTSDPEDLKSHDNYAIFASSVFQYITLSVVFSKGAPYRRPIYTNRLFTTSLVAMSALSAYLVIYPADSIAEFLELDVEAIPLNFRVLMVLLSIAHFILAFFAELDVEAIPLNFRVLMVLLSIAHFILAFFAESFIVDYLVFKKFRKWFPALVPSESLFKKIDNETKRSTRWLPNPLASYAKPHRRNGSTLSSSTNQMGTDVISKSSPPESGVWTQSQASGHSTSPSDPMARELSATCVTQILPLVPLRSTSEAIQEETNLCPIRCRFSSDTVDQYLWIIKGSQLNIISVNPKNVSNQRQLGSIDFAQVFDDSNIKILNVLQLMDSFETSAKIRARYASTLPTLPAMAYSSYYGGNRRDNNTESGMYARDGSPPRQQSYGGRRSPQMGRIPKINPTSSLDDLRSEFNRITDDTPLKVEDMTWEKMGTKVQDILEKRTNDPNNEGEQVFPAPMRRKNRDKRDMPLIINGNIVPRKDALLIDLVLNNKSTLDAQLTLTKHPVVGLEYMIEYIDPEGMSPRIYYCRLCKQFNTCASVMEHVTGYNHRVRFIANKYPNQAKTYLLPDGRRANRNVALMRMAQGRAQELELVYGRGDFEIRHEKVTIPDETQVDVESDIITVESGQQTEVLKQALKQIKACKLEGDEDIRVAKQIINDLTDAIIEYKQSVQEKQMNAGINTLIQQGRNY